VLPPPSVLKIEATYSSEKFVTMYQTTRPHRREEHSFERTFFKNPKHYQIWFTMFPSYESFSKRLCESLCFCCCRTLMESKFFLSRFQWPRGLRCVSAAARLLGLWVRIPPEAWMSVSSEYCVLSGRGLCVRLITHSEESYRVCLSVIVYPQ
jgi:hypothetical protein